MADIHCHICGADNPTGTELCQSCGASLIQQTELKNESAGSYIKTENPSDDAGSMSDKPEKPNDVEEENHLSAGEPVLTPSLDHEQLDPSGDGSENLQGDAPDSTPIDLPNWYEEMDNNDTTRLENGWVKENVPESNPGDTLEGISTDASSSNDTAALHGEGNCVDKTPHISETDQLTRAIESDEEVPPEPVMKSQMQAPDGEKGDGSPGDTSDIETTNHAAEEKKDWLDELGTFSADHDAGNVDAAAKEIETPDEEEVGTTPDREKQISEGIMPTAPQSEVVKTTWRSWSDWEKILPNEKRLAGAEPPGKKKKINGALKSANGEVTGSVEENGESSSLGEDLPGEKPAQDFGPLAGLNGILPGRELDDYITAPPVYSRSLHLSDAQRVQMGLLENILAEEDQPRSYIPQRTRKPHRLAQIIFTLIILVLLALPIFSNARLLALPEIIPVNTNNFYEIINNTLANPGSRVLIAAEYEPGFSGEMNAASLPVIDHLMEKEAYLTIISTIPTGPALAQSLLTQAHQQHQDYSLENNIVNLGYMAGNANSLQEFALRPQQAARYALNSIDMWGRHTALVNINNAGDYDLIIVLTSNIDKAKLWLEQVQPMYAGVVRVLFVASAQTAPVLSPYVDSGQIEGMVAGYAGGVAYELLTRSSIKGRIYWDSYQTAITLTVILILLGAIYQLFNSILRRGKKGRRK